MSAADIVSPRKRITKAYSVELRRRSPDELLPVELLTDCPSDGIYAIKEKTGDFEEGGGALLVHDLLDHLAPIGGFESELVAYGAWAWQGHERLGSALYSRSPGETLMDAADSASNNSEHGGEAEVERLAELGVRPAPRGIKKRALTEGSTYPYQVESWADDFMYVVDEERRNPRRADPDESPGVSQETLKKLARQGDRIDGWLHYGWLLADMHYTRQKLKHSCIRTMRESLVQGFDKALSSLSDQGLHEGLLWYNLRGDSAATLVGARRSRCPWCEELTVLPSLHHGGRVCIKCS